MNLSTDTRRLLAIVAALGALAGGLLAVAELSK
jgi:hypothetical protein